jgi:hypothetical protein
MKIKVLSTLVFFCAAFLSNAQTRYIDSIFATVTKTAAVKYGENFTYESNFTQKQDLLMDIYTPDGDTATNRPLIILSHAGSFLSPSLSGYTWGTREQNAVVEMCKRFAKRGYVAVSISYRLGWNVFSADQTTRAKTIINAVFLAMQDKKMCVRHFRNDAENGTNTYGIDPCKIFVGGTNSGAYVALAVGNLNNSSEFNLLKFLDENGNPFVNQAISGDFEGKGGTKNVELLTNISNEVSGVLSLGGAVGDTSWIDAGEPPVVALHGVAEQTTPYNTDIVIVAATGTPIIEVSGPGDFMPRTVRLGNNQVFAAAGLPQGPPNVQGGAQTTPLEGLYPFYGQEFEPWMWYDGTPPAFNANATQAKAFRYIDTIMNYTLPRFKLIIDKPCVDTTLSVRDFNNAVKGFITTPNPAQNFVAINIAGDNAPIAEASLFDISGRLVRSIGRPETLPFSIPTHDLQNGAYIVRIRLTDGKAATSRVIVHR